MYPRRLAGDLGGEGGGGEVRRSSGSMNFPKLLAPSSSCRLRAKWECLLWGMENDKFQAMKHNLFQICCGSQPPVSGILWSRGLFQTCFKFCLRYVSAQTIRLLIWLGPCWTFHFEPCFGRFCTTDLKQTQSQIGKVIPLRNQGNSTTRTRTQ